MKRLLLTSLVFVMAVTALATPKYWETFMRVYQVKPGSAIDQTQCSTCHTDVPKHNLFGTDVKAGLQASRTKSLTETILRQVELRDSDGDGWTNGDEIARDFLPGDPKSHPKRTPPVQSAGAMADKGQMSRMSADDHRSMMDQMVPKHTFHPVIVHFPVALFIFGTLLEILGFVRKRPALREAAYWNLLAGSVTTTAAIATGFVVALRLGYSLLPGTAVFTHLAVAILASLAMLATVLWRRKGLQASWRYFALLVLSALLVGLAGHFGGGMVYG